MVMSNINNIIYLIISLFCEIVGLLLTVEGLVIFSFGIIKPERIEFEYFYFYFDFMLGIFILIFGLAFLKFGMICYSKRVVKKNGIEKID